MARPTDPAKLAALRARQAANSKAYRARKAAERAAPQTAPTTPGNAGNEPEAIRRLPSSEEAVQRAHDAKAAARARRHEVIGGRWEIIVDGQPRLVGGLTSARNPRVRVHVPQERETTPAAMPDTAPKRRQRVKVLRERMDAEKLQNIGRNRKAYYGDLLNTDNRSEQIKKNLTPSQLARVSAASKRLGKASQQTLAIFLNYEGGEGELQAIVQQLAYPGQHEADIEDNLDRLENVADQIERAESLYGPKAVGRLRV